MLTLYLDITGLQQVSNVHIYLGNSQSFASVNLVIQTTQRLKIKIILVTFVSYRTPHCSVTRVWTMVLLLQFDKIIIKMVLEAEMLCACSVWEAEVGRIESSRPNSAT